MDNFINFIKDYNKKLNPVINSVFNKEQKKVSAIVPMAGGMIDDYKQFLSGGKKLRGSEIYLGYKLFGGKDEKTGLLASLTIEIIHSFLLMHDDFMDQDDLRRGNPTIHKRYEKIFGDKHYGEAMAVTLGDEGCFLAYRILNSLDLPSERIVKATHRLSDLLIEVGIGQALDLTYEKERDFTEEKVLRVHRYKTADYTISGPLTIGAILAGADNSKLKALKDFGVPVGIAFQLRDDELGMYSTEEVLGKPVDSDIKEGKVTLLFVKAFEKASKEDKGFLEYAHGNQDLSQDGVERVRGIIKKTGAYDYSRKLSRKLVEEGKVFIPKIIKDKKNQQLLTELADFMIERES